MRPGQGFRLRLPAVHQLFLERRCLGRAGLLGALLDHQQPPVPAEAVLAADLVGDAHDQGAVEGISGQERRARADPLRQKQDLSPYG